MQRIAVAALLAAVLTFVLITKYVERLRFQAVSHAIESGEALGPIVIPWFGNPLQVAVLVGALVAAGGTLWRFAPRPISVAVLSAIATGVVAYTVTRPITERWRADAVARAVEEGRWMEALSSPWYTDPLNIAVLLGLVTLVIGLVHVITERRQAPGRKARARH